MYNVLWDPGYLPLGAERVQAESTSHDSKRSHRKRHHRKSSSRQAGNTEKAGQSNVDLERGINAHAGGKAYQLDSAGLESFYTKDVFVCQEDGRPSYCSSCCQFKTDRAHHCREVDRCVRKMDHFCPWYVIKRSDEGSIAKQAQGWRRGLGDFLQIFHPIRGLHVLLLCISLDCDRVLYGRAATPCECPCTADRTHSLTTIQTGSVNAHWCVCIGL